MGACLGISTDSSQTRASVPIAARQSVHDMPVVAGSLKRIKRQGSVLVRSKKLETSSQEVYQRASILAFAVQAHAEPRGDGVTAAFRSKTRRLLALPRPWRTHAPHFRARRPQLPPIPSWFVHSVKGARSPPLRLALQTCPRRASNRNDTGTMVGHCGWYFQTRTAANTSQRPRTEPRAAAAAYDRVRPRVLRQHFGHSGAIPAASTGEYHRSTACSRRPQRWG